MLAYRNIVYLDVQKTGSTYIRSFLLKHIRSKPLFTRKHAPINPLIGPRSYKFTSCRDPFEFYRSLYKYGCDKRGGVYKRVLKKNHRSLTYYDRTLSGFENWLRAILDPEQNLISENWYRRTRPELVGSLSARFLRLNIRYPELRLARCKTVNDVLDVYAKHAMAQDYVRNECLASDLLRLVYGPLSNYIHDIPAAESHLNSGKKVNQSETKFDFKISDIGADVRNILYEREFLFYDALGYKRF